jgi:hypothetical protein
MAAKPIRDRILSALERGPLDRHQLMLRVFPPDAFPRAWNHGHQGGPPGCAMPFRRAVAAMERDGLIVRSLDGMRESFAKAEGGGK